MTVEGIQDPADSEGCEGREPEALGGETAEPADTGEFGRDSEEVGDFEGTDDGPAAEDADAGDKGDDAEA